MRSTSVLPAGALALIVGLSACASEPEPVPVERATDELAAAICALAVERCPSPDFVAMLPPGLDCEDMYRLETFNGYEPVEEMVEGGRVEYDAEAMGRVLEGFRTLPCAEVLNRLNTGSWISDVFRGTVPPGGECLHPFDCRAGSRCAGSTCPGTCEALAALGEPCSTNRDCGDGFCDGTSTCAPAPALGEACIRRSDCAEGVCGGEGVCVGEGANEAWCTLPDDCDSGYCAVPDGAWTGTCAAAPADGIPCRASWHCPITAPICAQTGTEGRCRTVAERGTAAEGDACDPSGETAPLCREGLACASTGTTAQPFVCRARAASGGACAEAVPSMCPRGEYCAVAQGAVEGTCRLLPVAGEACVLWESPLMADALLAYCAAGYQCESDWSDGTSLTCFEVREKGEPCTLDAGCVTHQCGGDGVCTFDFCE